MRNSDQPHGQVFRTPRRRLRNDASWDFASVAEPPAVEYGASAFTPDAYGFAQQIALEVFHNLGPLARSYALQGRSLTELGTPQEVAARMVATLPSPSPWNDLLGPFYSGAQISRVLGGISRQALAERRERRTLIALRTSDGVWAYPAFQLGDDHRPLPGLIPLWQTLCASGVDDWSAAGWLCSPLASLSGKSPASWLREGGEPEAVLPLAREAAHRFAQ
ncbi:MAG: hypothetical protein U0002_21225 [Thermoanaerobaculia bacterium]